MSTCFLISVGKKIKAELHIFDDIKTTRRYLYERAVITRDYGMLLTKWEKREESGHNMIRDADIIFDMLSSSAHATEGGDRKDMITSMTLLPTEIYTAGA